MLALSPPQSIALGIAVALIMAVVLNLVARIPPPRS